MRRDAKVPILVLNAATLNTGHTWQFTVSWMGESPNGISSEIDGNDHPIDCCKRNCGACHTCDPWPLD